MGKAQESIDSDGEALYFIIFLLFQNLRRFRRPVLVELPFLFLKMDAGRTRECCPPSNVFCSV
jgi:hypothetical protein